MKQTDIAICKDKKNKVFYDGNKMIVTYEVECTKEDADWILKKRGELKAEPKAVNQPLKAGNIAPPAKEKPKKKFFEKVKYDKQDDSN